MKTLSRLIKLPPSSYEIDTSHKAMEVDVQL